MILDFVAWVSLVYLTRKSRLLRRDNILS
ncbi:MAG: hypothetical protein UW64_C0030G0023, partial [Microgenomates group bacterium GW2011_GWC1_44_37]